MPLMDNRLPGRMTRSVFHLVFVLCSVCLCGAGMGLHKSPPEPTGKNGSKAQTSTATSWGLLQTKQYAMEITIEGDRAWLTQTQMVYNPTFKTRDVQFIMPWNGSMTDFDSDINDLGAGIPDFSIDQEQRHNLLRRLLVDTKSPWCLGAWDSRIVSTTWKGFPGRREKTWTSTWRQELPQKDGVRRLSLDLSWLRVSAVDDLEAKIAFHVRLPAPLQMVYCPAARMHFSRKDRFSMDGTISMPAESAGIVDLYFIQGDQWMSPHLVCHGIDSRSGYFAVLIQAPEMEDKKEDSSENSVEPPLVVMVIDTSAGMQGAKIDLARDVVLSVMEKFADKIPIVVCTASQPTKILATSSQWMSAFGHDKLLNNILSLRAGLKAAAGRAVEGVLADEKREKAVVLWLTDGITGTSDPMAGILPGNGLVIYPIGLGRRVDVEVLEKIARRYGGQVRFLMPGDIPADKLGDLFNRLGSSRALLRTARLVPVNVRVSPSSVLELGDLFAGTRKIVTGRYERLGDNARLDLAGEGTKGTVRIKGQGVFPDRAESNPFCMRLDAWRSLGRIYDLIWHGGKTEDLAEDAVSLYSDYGIPNLYADSVFVTADDIEKTESTVYMARKVKHDQYSSHMKLVQDVYCLRPASDDIYSVGIDNAEGFQAIEATRTIRKLKNAKIIPKPEPGLLLGFGKPKRLVGQTWMDIGTESATAMHIEFGSTDYLDLLEYDGMARNLAAGSRVRFRFGTTVYDIGWEVPDAAGATCFSGKDKEDHASVDEGIDNGHE